MQYRKYINAGLLILISLLIASVTIAGAATTKPLVPPSLSDGWNQISTNDFTFPVVVGCHTIDLQPLKPACSNCPSTNPAYSFFVRKGTVNKLVIFFNGGGACWDTANCLQHLTYTPMVFENVVSSQLCILNPTTGANPPVNQGIFDFSNSDNPFKNWYVVYLPYCTGDLFWGAKDNPYPIGPTSIPIQHRGFVNFMAVLKWVQNNFRCPLQIFVTGSSAGGYGAIVNYPYIRESFPLTRVYVLGDASNGVTGVDETTGKTFNQTIESVWDVQFPTWILGNDFSQLTSEDVMTNIAAEYPLMKFAQFTTAYDETQTKFFRLQENVKDFPFHYLFPTGNTAYDSIYYGEWHQTMTQYAHGTATLAPNYRYYIGAGGIHTILGSPKFYTETSAGGVSFSQWVKSMVENPFGVFGGPLQGIWTNLENDSFDNP